MTTFFHPSLLLLFLDSGAGFLYDADPELIFHHDADLDPDPCFQIKVQTLEKVLEQAHITNILACHLQN
jgi:hypothetical protein